MRYENPEWAKAYHLLNLLCQAATDANFQKILFGRTNLKNYYGSSYTIEEMNAMFNTLWCEQIKNMPECIIDTSES